MGLKAITEWLQEVRRQGACSSDKARHAAADAHAERIAELVTTGRSHSRPKPRPRLHTAFQGSGGGYDRVCTACGKTELEIAAYGIRECSGPPRPQHQLEPAENVGNYEPIGNKD